MSYTPHRDYYRFEYVSDIANWVEENQCFNCVYRKTDSEFIMCHEIETKVMLEEEIEEWDDLGELGLKCYKRNVSFT